MPSASATTGQPHRPVTGERIACRLKQIEKSSRHGSIPGMGELELENVSTKPIEIRFQLSPLQYLDLVVTGPAGGMVSEGCFSDRFSPLAEEQVLSLQPGEKFISELPLLSTVPHEKRLPGAYGVQAVYEYGSDRAISATIEVTL